MEEVIGVSRVRRVRGMLCDGLSTHMYAAGGSGCSCMKVRVHDLDPIVGRSCRRKTA